VKPIIGCHIVQHLAFAVLIAVGGGFSFAQGETPVVSQPPTLDNAIVFSPAPVPAYEDARLRHNIGTINADTPMRFLEQTGDVSRVKASVAGTDKVVWVETSRLGPLPKRIAAHLEQSAERQRTVAAVIREGNVAVGMKSAEVVAAIGRPDRTAEETTANGTRVVWEYIKRDFVDVNLGLGIGRTIGHPGRSLQSDPYRRSYFGVGASVPGEERVTRRVTFEQDIAVKVERFDN
jgi:hypothetical protein